MIRATLLRQLKTDDQGCPGVLSVLGKTWFTLELPWRNNAPGLSCIPAGEYRVIWSLSPRLRRFTYEILGVPARAGIRMHNGNLAGATDKGFISHSLGCPLLGDKRGTLQGQRAVLLSKAAVANFERFMAGRPFLLEIKEVQDA